MCVCVCVCARWTHTSQSSQCRRPGSPPPPPVNNEDNPRRQADEQTLRSAKPYCEKASELSEGFTWRTEIDIFSFVELKDESRPTVMQAIGQKIRATESERERAVPLERYCLGLVCRRGPLAPSNKPIRGQSDATGALGRPERRESSGKGPFRSLGARDQASGI